MSNAGEVREVEGRAVHLPFEVRDASAGTAMFLIDLREARCLLPDDLQPLPVVPRRTALTLVMVEYRDTPIGPYREVAVQLTVAPAGPRGLVEGLTRVARGRPDTWTVAMPVTESVSVAAGRDIWGFPKTLDELEFDQRDGRATATWRAQGRHVLTLSVPVGRDRAMPAPGLRAFTILDGRPTVTDFAMWADHGRLGAGGAHLELGDHPFADVLRRLGLPRRAMLTTWMDDVRASFGSPAPR